MIGPDGFYLTYKDSAFTAPRCWSISPTKEAAIAEIEGMLDQHPDPSRITSAQVEEWSGGNLLAITPVPTRKEL